VSPSTDAVDHRTVRQRLAADPAGTGVFLDFDGTLTPFAAAAHDICLADELLLDLKELSEGLGAVAVVSGRPLRFLVDAFPFPEIRLAGVYGLEEWAHGAAHDAPGVAQWLPVIAEARDELADAASSFEGVELRDKRVSVVVHWGRAAGGPDVGAHLMELTRRLAARTGLRHQAGKVAEELLPPVPIDKGSVVRRMAREAGLRNLIYVGDDLGDLAAFNAVHEYGGIAIAVDGAGDSHQRAPAEVLRAADLVLAGPEAVIDWLRTLRDDLAGAV
jgi:trehalose 6-phosphate phosphatase